MPPQLSGRGRGTGSGSAGPSTGRDDGWREVSHGRGDGGAGRGAESGSGRGGSGGRGGGGYGGGDRGGFRGRGSGDRGRGGDRGGGGGFRGGRGGGPSAPQVFAPRYIPDPAQATGGPGPTIAPGVVTVGVRRPVARGIAGRPLTVTTNNFVVTIPEVTIHHYDVDIKGADKAMPVKFNLDLIRILQERIAPNIFTPRVVYDGRKNIFGSRALNLSGGDSQTFDVTMSPPREGARPPKEYKVTIKKAAEISPTLLNRYQRGQQSYDNMVSTALTAINVIIRMEPIMRYPHNSRSFFTDKETWSIGGGIDLWRGYFQSVRPGLRSMLMNIDISTGAMYTPGPMISVCQTILGNPSPNGLVPGQELGDRDRLLLQRFLTNVRFTTSYKDKHGRVSDKPQTLKKISKDSAANYKFELSDGTQTTVAQYFRTLGVNLQYPNYVCIETGRGAAFPIELCSIIPGQMMRKQVPSHLTKNVLDFSTKKPQQRLDSIVAGHSVLQYGQSEYMRQFGMTVSQTPESCLARVLPTPALNYGPGSKLKQITPRDGSWNTQHQKFYKPATVTGWALVVYDGRNIRRPEVDFIIQGLKIQADLLGIKGFNSDPPVSFPPLQALNVHYHLRAAGAQVLQATNTRLSLIVVILPDNSGDLYQAIKHFGDVKRGVATQCLLGSMAKRSGAQYYANVWLKINAKLGGVNNILDPNAQRFIFDAASPVMIIGAHVWHPASGAHGRPSFPAVVGSVDSNATRYVAVSGPQESRLGMILDLENLVYELIGRHAWWKTQMEKKQQAYPTRIVFYRDGVPEGQFSRVLRHELKAIQDACERHKIDPAITFIVVNKRHRVRFFPTHGMADKTGNCPAGTVVDDVVGHPTEFDFYLQGHGGLNGTSHPARYSVLHDENNFTPDSLQALSFALCHVNARTTRSVSIPAPVSYANIVCERAKNHFHPSINYGMYDLESIGETSSSIIQRYQPMHAAMRYKMFFL